MDANGFQELNSSASHFHATQFLVKMMMSRICVATLVQVQAVTNDGGVVPVGFVDILPMVNMLDGNDIATQHSAVRHCPYFRLQGGANAVIIDPEVGDIGIAVFADRDISSAVANQAQSNPGSRRRFDMADALYIGGFCNDTPEQYIQFVTAGDSKGITITSPTRITLNAPLIALNGMVTQAGGADGSAVSLTGPVSVVHDVVAGGVSAIAHTHINTMPGTGTSGPPEPTVTVSPFTA